MREKTRRQTALRRLVKRHHAHDQQELVALLQEQGIPATQASVSRDLRELGLVKVDGEYVSAERLSRGRDGAFRNELITSAEPVGAHLIVIHTIVGGAGAVAVEVDRRHIPDVVGTIAGDDTIFVAVRSRSAQGRVLAQLLRGEPAPKSHAAAQGGIE